MEQFGTRRWSQESAQGIRWLRITHTHTHKYTHKHTRVQVKARDTCQGLKSSYQCEVDVLAVTPLQRWVGGRTGSVLCMSLAVSCGSIITSK